MFTLEQNINGPELRKKDLLKFFFSMNTHQVATPEMMLEDARSYVLLFREPGGKRSSYVALHLLQTGRTLFYAHGSNPFAAEETDSVEEEALCFVEGLGALIDSIDLAKLTDEEKKRRLDDLDIFAASSPPPGPPGAQPADVAAPETPVVLQEPQEAEAPQAAKAPARPQARPAGRAVRSKAAPVATSSRDRQDLTQKTIKTRGVEEPKRSMNKEVRTAAGVVSRDREALARLLTSF